MICRFIKKGRAKGNTSLNFFWMRNIILKSHLDNMKSNKIEVRTFAKPLWI